MTKPRGKTVPSTGAMSPQFAATLASIDGFYRAIRQAIRWIGIVLTIFAIGYAIRPFAGERTIVSLAMSFLADVKFVAAVALTGVAAAWASVERILRLRKTEQLQGRIIELERRLDPNRSSSGLTTQGTTNPRDR